MAPILRRSLNGVFAAALVGLTGLALLEPSAAQQPGKDPLKAALQLPTGPFATGLNGLSLAVSPDGSRIAPYGRDMKKGESKLHVFDAASGKVLHTADCPKPLENKKAADKPKGRYTMGLHPALDFSPDGKTLAVAHAGEILLYSADLKRELKRIPVEKGSSDYRSVRFAPGSSLLVAMGLDELGLYRLGEDKALRIFVRGLWPADRPEMGLREPVSVSRKVVAVGDVNGLVRLFELPSGREGKRVDIRSEGDIKDGLAGVVDSLRMSADGKRLAAVGMVGEKSVVVVWELPALKEVARFAPTGRGLPALALSPDGSRLILSSDTPLFKATLEWWDVKGKKQLHVTPPSKTVIWSLEYFADGKKVAGISLREGAVHIWDAETGKVLASPEVRPAPPKDGGRK